MIGRLLHLSRRAIIFNSKGVLFQVIIIITLTAVITGSLMTGNSVRNSLKATTEEKLGNCGLAVSSGLRYFDTALVTRLAKVIGEECTGLLEIDGFSQNLTAGKTVQGVKIIAVEDDFFNFHGNNQTKFSAGEVLINDKLADQLGLHQGDEIALRFNSLSELPADAPFSQGEESGNSIVLRIGEILSGSNTGNFSLSISQITPLNIFIRISDLENTAGRIPGFNRILIANRNNITVNDVYSRLKRILRPEDIGLEIRKIRQTDGYELISGRIFIDQPVVDCILLNIPAGKPVITYLANSISKGIAETPYSFVSALPPSILPGLTDDKGIIINDWLAGDIGVAAGDTIILAWYSPDKSTLLREVKADFVVSKVVEMEGIWADSLLMPEFPGIAGSESCSDWDAGVTIKMNKIRKKDEEYWNIHKGTPKAFISYETGKKLWGNNFGPATSVRFPADLTEKEIREALSGGLDPEKSGFVIRNIKEESVRAADEGVDFSSLFLSLGFFVIFSSILLLSLVISAYFESKKEHIRILYYIGFPNRLIKRILLLETVLISLAGIIPGVFAGELFNIIIIKALNSVWAGAVQTTTLLPHFDPYSMAAGSIITLMLVLFVIEFRIRRFLPALSGNHIPPPAGKSHHLSSIAFILLLPVALILLVASFFAEDNSSTLSFISGIILFAGLVALAASLYIKGSFFCGKGKKRSLNISYSYYSKHLSHAITPVIFLAAGVFAVIITGINKLQISDNMLGKDGGTGGYTVWAETTVAVPGNLNERAVRTEYGLDGDEFNGVTFVQAKRSGGDDASCLNLNHVAVPALLGLDPVTFIQKGSFSASSVMPGFDKNNPWSALDLTPGNNTIYGIADQTVLDWGLKLKAGDTLIMKSESGQPLNIIIAAGLKASVFQGYVILGDENFRNYFPSASGSNVFLAMGNGEMTDTIVTILNDRLSSYGIIAVKASSRLASFFRVTNTYLQVFTILGAFGVIMGVVGMGFILMRNFQFRKRDFSLMLALGFSISAIRKIINEEHIRIILTGIFTGVFSALFATSSSLRGNEDISPLFLIVFLITAITAGFLVTFLSTGTVSGDSLRDNLKKE